MARRERHALSFSAFTRISPLVMDVLESHRPAEDLARHFDRPCPGPKLEGADLVQYRREIEIIGRILDNALENATIGVNILIVCEPCMLRDEIPRFTARKFGFELHEVVSTRKSGKPISADTKLSACRLAQCLHEPGTRKVLLFQATEPASYDDYDVSVRSIVAMRQASPGVTVEAMLEDNPVPVVWLHNNVQFVDHSFLRKFDFILPLAGMTAALLKRVLIDSLHGREISDRWLDRFSLCDDLTTEDLENAVKTARLAGCTTRTDTEMVMESTLENVLMIRGCDPPPASRELGVAGYDTRYVNASRDIEELTSRLAVRPRGLLLLHGPPGTGKSAWAAYVSRRAGKKLLVRRASDLLDKYIGETEKRIAGMFHEASRTGSILLLEEADSFLRERSNAQFRWEITDVNELLVQMEQFDQLLLCTTNLLEDLDTAAYRRFDIKIKFDYMRPDQSWTLFTTMLEDMHVELSSDSSDLEESIKSLKNLTPGDFSTVRRQIEILDDDPSPRKILDLLKEECRVKPDRKGERTGFAR